MVGVSTETQVVRVQFPRFSACFPFSKLFQERLIVIKACKYLFRAWVLWYLGVWDSLCSLCLGVFYI